MGPPFRALRTGFGGPAKPSEGPGAAPMGLPETPKGNQNEDVREAFSVTSFSILLNPFGALFGPSEAARGAQVPKRPRTERRNPRGQRGPRPPFSRPASARTRRVCGAIAASGADEDAGAFSSARRTRSNPSSPGRAASENGAPARAPCARPRRAQTL